MLYESIDQLVGHTPMLLPKQYNALHCAHGTLLCKLECFNPAGSTKDRVAKKMLNDAEREGLLLPGGTIIEPTSGNTGIGLASLGTARGYRVILTMPDSMSAERRLLLSAYGAHVVLTPGHEGMSGAIKKAHELAGNIPNSWIPSQFDNPSNPKAHMETTGPEIFSDTDGRIDCFVAGVGTGGTLSGTGAYLKKMQPNCRIIAVEPSRSPVLSGGEAGAHGLQGIGANFVPKNFDPSIPDEILSVCEDEAYEAARRFVREEGVLIGISSGAALHAATCVANRPEMDGKRIVVLLPDTGERYLSTPLYNKGK